MWPHIVRSVNRRVQITEVRISDSLLYTTIVARAVVFHKSACASRGHTILYSSKLTAPRLFRLQTLTYDLGGIVLDQ